MVSGATGTGGTSIVRVGAGRGGAGRGGAGGAAVVPRPT